MSSNNKQQAIDLHQLCSSITCNLPESEHAPASHLLNGGQFCAESFVRAPVSLVLVFKRAIHISGIQLGLKHKNNQVNGLSIFASPTPDSNLEYKIAEYRASPRTPMESITFGYAKDQYPFQNTTHLKKCHKMTIRIIHARGTPSLNYLKLFANGDVPRIIEANEDIQTTSTFYGKRPAATTSSDKMNSIVHQSPTTSHNNPTAAESIPTEYLCALTQEPMCQPITLPCGMIIDRHSLQLYLDEQRKLGRPDNDPYTGAVFNNTNTPTPNVSLKHTIDTFWLDNPDLARQMNPGRTVGVTANTNKRKLDRQTLADARLRYFGSANKRAKLD